MKMNEYDPKIIHSPDPQLGITPYMSTKPKVACLFYWESLEDTRVTIIFQWLRQQGLET